MQPRLRNCFKSHPALRQAGLIASLALIVGIAGSTMFPRLLSMPAEQGIADPDSNEPETGQGPEIPLTEVVET